MTQLRIDFQGRGNAQIFSWACAQAMRNGVQLTLGVDRQVRALRQVLAQQARGVFIGPALPGTMGIGKEDAERKPVGQALVLVHLI